LVERLLCKQDVSGSSPLTSTRKSSKSRADSAPYLKETERMLDEVHLARTLKTA
jgi:hypothetical protein